jgi:peptide/nickel transport system ATP-binding protein
MEQPLLQTIDLKKHFKVSGGVLHAVDGVNLEIKEGQTLRVVGESGCGKSTLGRTILQLTKPTSGQIIFDGKDVTKLSGNELLNLRKEMQIIFQDPFSSLDPRRSVYELIAEPLIRNHIYKNKNDQYDRVLELMKIVGLAERFINVYPHEMDGGRRQRVGIARALALNPKFIVCDEPVSALDVSIQAQIINLLMDLQEEMKLTYIFITHDLSVVKHISDNIAVMYLGQCVERATAKELFSNPLHPYTKALLSAIPLPKLGNKKSTQIIKGEVSDPINPQPGCRFASRCDYCKDECKKTDIALKRLNDEHYVACCLYK